MNRRSFGLAALFSAAIAAGAFLGGTANVPDAHAKAAAAADQAPPAAQAPVTQAKPKVCKVTKDCPADHLCMDAGDHKECTPAPSKEPIRPPMT